MMEQELQRLGWNLSFDGLEQCKEACSQKGAGLDVKHVVRVAINRDLREIGKPVLPEFASRNGTGEISGPVIVQIQRLRNVGVPSAKQHSDAVSKRLLRLQLTDGHTHCNAIEIDGPISGLSPSTPPGTKLKIISKVQVIGGFVLLNPGAVQVCGGTVEHMVKKWNLQKISAEGVQRDRVGDTSGPPPFIPFEKTTATKPLPSKTQHTKSSTEKNTSGQKPAGRSSTSIKAEKRPIKDTVGDSKDTREVLQKNESSKQTDQPRESKREEKIHSGPNEHYRVQEKGKEKGGAVVTDKRSQKEVPQKKQKPTIDHRQDSNQPSSQDRSDRRDRSEHMRERRHSNRQGQKTGRTVDLSEWIGTRIAEPPVTQREEDFREESGHSRHHDRHHDQSDRYRDQHDRHQSDRHRDQHDRHQPDRHRDQHDRHQPDRHRDQHDRHQPDRHRDQHDRHQPDRHRDQHDRHQPDRHHDQHGRHQSDRYRDQHDRHQSDQYRDQHDRHQSDQYRDQHDRHQSDRYRDQHDRHQSDRYRDQHDRHQSDRHHDQHGRHQSDRYRDQHDRHQSDRYRDQHDQHQSDRYRNQHDRHQSDRYGNQHDRHQPPTSSDPLDLEQYHWDKMVNSKSTVPFSAKPSASNK